MLRRSILALAVVSTSALASASTYVVNASGGLGVDFTDIPPAIAFAQPGDVLLVAAGGYSGFTLDKGLVIVGSAGASTSAPIQVRGIAANERAAIVSIRPPDLIVDTCAGPVVIQDMGNVRTASISASNDVRMSGVSLSDGQTDALAAIALSAARLELVSVTAFGHLGSPAGTPFGQGTDGGPAVRMTSTARLVAAACTLRGGNGSDETMQDRYAGGAGAGIETNGPASVVLLGPSCTVDGACPGTNYYYFGSNCMFDGAPQSAIFGTISGASVFASNVTFHVCSSPVGFHCFTITPPVANGVAFTTISPGDPALSVSGAPVAGATLTFTVTGEPGASATLVLGRGLVVQPTPGVRIEELVPRARVFALGAIPAGGTITRTIPLPASLPHGVVFAAQAEVVGTNGLQRTNSTPVVVR